MSGLAKYERFDKDGIELVIDCNTGETFSTERGYARMSGKPYSTINSRITRMSEGDRNTYTKYAEINTMGGMQGVRMINEDLIVKWLPKDNPTMATQLLKLGVRGFLHKLAGYEITSTAVQPVLPKTYGEALLEAGRLAVENEKLAEQNLLLTGAKVMLESRNNQLKEDVTHLEEVVDQQEPYARLGAALANVDENCMTVADFAKAHTDMGSTKLFRKLREISFIMAGKCTPYQKHVDADRAKVVRVQRDGQPWVYDKTTILTPKGQKYVLKKLYELEKAEKAEQQHYGLDESDF
jgi:phage antirepressor YoqD-like protein